MRVLAGSREALCVGARGREADRDGDETEDGQESSEHREACHGIPCRCRMSAAPRLAPVATFRPAQPTRGRHAEDPGRVTRQGADVNRATRIVAQNTPRGRNCTEIRGPAWATFGHGVLPGALAGAAHDDEVAVAHLERERLTAAARPERQPSRVSEGDDRDHRVVGATSPEPVTVPGDAVAPVAVVAATRGQERLAELGAVVLRQGVARLHQQRMGEWLPLAVGVHEPGHVDHPVVHLPPLGPPRDVGDQPLQHLVGTRHEVAAYVDPGAAGQRLTLGVRQRAQPRGRRLEERPLEVHASDGST